MIVSNRTAFWDGDNFVIVSKHCTKEQAVKLLQALASADIGDIEPAPESYAEPVEEPEEVMPAIPDGECVEVQGSKPEPFRLQGGKYKGMTPEEALAQDKAKAFRTLGSMKARMQASMESLPPEQKAVVTDTVTAVGDALEMHFRKVFGGVKDPYRAVTRLDEKKCDRFFSDYGCCILTAEESAKVLEQSGTISIKAFLKEASLEQKRSLIAEIIKKHCAI